MAYRLKLKNWRAARQADRRLGSLTVAPVYGLGSRENNASCHSLHTIQGNIAGDEAFYIKIMTSQLWRHGVTWRHREHDHSIACGHFPIGCPLELSRYLASFPRYLASKLRQRLLRNNVISDVISPRSTIREDHIDIEYRGTLCSSIVQFRQELPEKNHFIKSWRRHYDVIESRIAPSYT